MPLIFHTDDQDTRTLSSSSSLSSIRSVRDNSSGASLLSSRPSSPASSGTEALSSGIALMSVRDAPSSMAINGAGRIGEEGAASTAAGGRLGSHTPSGVYTPGSAVTVRSSSHISEEQPPLDEEEDKGDEGDGRLNVALRRREEEEEGSIGNNSPSSNLHSTSTSSSNSSGGSPHQTFHGIHRSGSTNTRAYSLDETRSLSIVTFLPRATRPAPLTLPYKSSPNPFHTLDLYLPASGLAPSTPWFFFLHGGYWQDATQSKDVGSVILSRLPAHWAGASIDYRLSPEIAHPGHLDDVKRAFKFVRSAYDISKAVIMAHGAGACIAYQYIFSELAMGKGDWISHVITSGGVYDLPELAKDSPYYYRFIADAYGNDQEHWYDLSPQNFEWESVYGDEQADEPNQGSAHELTGEQALFQGMVEASLPSTVRSPLEEAIWEMTSQVAADTARENSTRRTGAASSRGEAQEDGKRAHRMDLTLVHSKFDLIVPIRQSLRFEDRLTEAGFRCSLRLLSIDGHDTVLETTELALIALEVCKHMDEEEERLLGMHLG